MKTKNTKIMMLSVMAVAFVAFAAFAVVADANESKAVDPSGSAVAIATDIKDNVNYRIYGNIVGTASNVKADFTYSGTIWFGGYNSLTQTDFRPLVAITFDKVTGVTAFYKSGEDKVVLRGATSGTMTVTMGQVQLGDATAEFSGKVVCGDATVDAQDVIKGLTLKCDDNVLIGGTVATTAAAVDVEIDGKAAIAAGLTIGTKVTVKVLETAELIGDKSNSVPYDMSPTSLTMKVGNVNAVAGKSMFDNDTNQVGRCAAGNSDVVQTIPANSALGTHTLGMAYLDATTGTKAFMYYGNLDFKVSNTGNVSYEYGKNLISDVLSFGDVTVTSNVNGNAKLDIAPGKVTTMKFVYGGVFVNALNDVTTTVTNSRIAGGANYLAATGWMAGVVYDSLTDKYCGVVVSGSAATSNKFTMGEMLVASPSGTTATATTLIMPAAPAAATSTAINYMTVTGTLNVDGKVMLKNNGKVVTINQNAASSIIVGKGSLAYISDSSNKGLIHDAPTKLKAVCTTVDNEVDYIHYYTTLADATAKGKHIVFYGAHTLDKDVTISGLGATKLGPGKITIDTNSVVTIGTRAAGTVVDTTPVVTIPEISTIVNNGAVQVCNGQFKVFGDTTVAAKTPNVLTDIRHVITDFGVYCDLGTALGLSKSGDTLTLLRNVVNVVGPPQTFELNKTCELKDGVTLSTTTFNIEIQEGKTFTVAGTLTSTGGTVETKYTTASGPSTLILKNAKSTIPATNQSGIVTFTKEYDNTATGSGTIGTMTAATNNTVFNIDGTLKGAPASGNIISAGGLATAVNVTGTWTINNTTNLGAGIVTLTVTGSGKIVSGITAAAKGTVSVLVLKDKANVAIDTGVANSLNFVVGGKAFIGNKDSFTNDVNATVWLTDSTAGTYIPCTVYGKAANVKVLDSTGNTVKLMKTELKTCNKDTKNVKDVYQTSYASAVIGISTDNMLISIPNAVRDNYRFGGWYEGDDWTHPVTSAKMGQFDTLFGYFEAVKYNVTFEAAKGVEWYIDGKKVVGMTAQEFGAHKVTVKAEKGYDAKEVKITKDGAAYTAGTSFDLGANATFTATDAKENANSGGIGIVEIMLIIITITCVIMAIVVALKLMRS